MASNQEPKPPLTMAERGRLGGLATKERLGKEHYARIGKRGGTTLATTGDPNHYRRIGRIGGLKTAARHADAGT